ncbi:MAG: hypothetical protein ACKOC4_13615, partial [Planctomycetia bacterium]
VAPKNPKSEMQLPAALRETLQRLVDLISNDTAKRELWSKRFTAADRRKFEQPGMLPPEKHGIIDLWRIARGTPTWNECIVEIAHALGFINGPRRDSLLGELGAKPPVGSSRKARSAAIPHWDEDARELRYLGQVVRVVKRPKQAYNIVEILRAFETAGWPARIDDPLRRNPNDETRRRDVENLKKGLLKPLLSFECDGTGTGFLWKKVSTPNSKKPAKRPRR